MPMDLEGIAAKETPLTVEFNGETCELTYDPTQMSKQFRAEVLRLQRAYTKLVRKRDLLLEKATLVVAADGTLEAAAEDEEAEAAIQALVEDDSSIKGQIDAALASIITSWDLTYNKKSPKRVPIFTEENGQRKPHPELAKVPIELEAELLNAIMTDATPGEADGAETLNSSASTLKPGAKLATLPPRQIGSRRSRRLRGSQRSNLGNG